MGTGHLAEKRDNHGIGPQRTKRPGSRFHPYGAGREPAERPIQVLNPGLEIPQLPRQSEPRSKTLSERYDIDEGYDSGPIEAYDLTRNHKAAVTASVGDYYKWDTAPAESIRSCSGFGSGWDGKRPLGLGGFGMAGLWEKRDNNGTVIEVRKACFMCLTKILRVFKSKW